MSSVAVLLLLLSAGLQSAFSLECYNCSYSIKDDCTTANMCSNEKNRCVLTVTESNISTATPTKYFSYSCGMKDDCDKKFSMSVTNTMQRSYTFCCSEHKCRPTNTETPKVKTEKNNLKCSHCFESNTDKCKNTTEVDCTGDEDKCFTYSYSYRNTAFVARGCMQSSMCDTKNVLIFPGIPNYTQKLLECSGAPSVLPHLLGPVAYGLVLLKLIS
ncbi:uncharacterized protein LOC108696804 [Xenopus laevis]|uniref:UPAR/Ly6 domain-containing protein n=2 Tax=Xenopus laevis TaxID=8355 RepID=A0A974CH88_XENLA|nr:uncharacterized protein LOC108696804 [Xenopus laevis]OCT73254.1 hypothetical protein XELAEV_18036234mg [Xenopus laevis]